MAVSIFSTLSLKLSPVVAALEGLLGSRIHGLQVVVPSVSLMSRSLTSLGADGFKTDPVAVPAGSIHAMVAEKGVTPFAVKV